MNKILAASAFALTSLALATPAHANQVAEMVTGAAKGTFTASQEPSGLLEKAAQEGGLIKTVTELGD